MTTHYSDVIISAMASQITGVSIVYSTVCSGADHRKHQSSVSLAFVRGIHRWPENSPHKGPVPRKMFPIYDVIMEMAAICSVFNAARYINHNVPHQTTGVPSPNVQNFSSRFMTLGERSTLADTRMIGRALRNTVLSESKAPIKRSG